MSKDKYNINGATFEEVRTDDKPSQNGHGSTSLTREQLRNAKKALRCLDKDKTPRMPLSDTGPLSPVLSILIEKFQRDGLAAYQAACKALEVDYPALSLLRAESKNKLIDIIELLSLPDQAWLLEDFLYEDVIAMLYGKYGCNKSFITIDWCCHMALGWTWHGHKTKKCRIIYVAAEGARGYRRRILAWCHEHNVDPQRLLNGITFLPREVTLGNVAELNDCVDEMTLTLEEIEESTAEKLPVIIVVDTIFQCSSGVDINSPAGMTTVLESLKYIKRETNSSIVLAVHHSGKDKERGAFGSTVLPASVDLAFSVEADEEGKTKLRAEKIKDDERAEIWLQRRQVVYNPNEARGHSCVMDAIDKPQQEGEQSAAMRMMLECVTSDAWISNSEWQAAINATFPKADGGSAITNTHFSRLLSDLQTLGLIEDNGKTRKEKRYRRVAG